jgi:hypothetical protein
MKVGFDPRWQHPGEACLIQQVQGVGLAACHSGRGGLEYYEKVRDASRCRMTSTPSCSCRVCMSENLRWAPSSSRGTNAVGRTYGRPYEVLDNDARNLAWPACRPQLQLRRWVCHSESSCARRLGGGPRGGSAGIHMVMSPQGRLPARQRDTMQPSRTAPGPAEVDVVISAYVYSSGCTAGRAGRGVCTESGALCNTCGLPASEVVPRRTRRWWGC